MPIDIPHFLYYNFSGQMSKKNENEETYENRP